jgi:carboxyl-terminal processing protease
MKKGRWKVALVSFSTLLSLFLLVGALLGQEKTTKEPYPQLAVLSEVLSRIQTDYVEEPNFGKVTNGALHSMLESLDPNSSYLSPEEYKSYQKKHDSGASIDAVVSKRMGFLSIVATLPGGAAQKAGLENGDVIEAIEGRSTREMPLAEVVQELEGANGSTVSLSIVRERVPDPMAVQVKRAPVVLPDATARMLEAGIGYLRVQALPKGETQKVAARIQELRKEGAKKFILDLRDDATGETEEGVATANLFLSKGLIAFVSGQQYPRKDFLADASKAMAQEPLAVLVNSATGGAAEIVAAAIMENNHRGAVVGERTFGIGSVQKVIPLDDGSALILSVAKYYTPGGKPIPEAGVTPSVPVVEERESGPISEGAAPAEPKPPSEDVPLKRAIELLSSPASQSTAA